LSSIVDLYLSSAHNSIFEIWIYAQTDKRVPVGFLAPLILSSKLIPTFPELIWPLQL